MDMTFYISVKSIESETIVLNTLLFIKQLATVPNIEYMTFCITQSTDILAN